MRSDLGVLRLTDMPAILVETAFIDHKNDALLLKNNPGDFAKAIYEGVMEFLGRSEEIDIIEKLAQMIEINDKETAGAELSKEKEKNSSLYWILYKVANS